MTHKYTESDFEEAALEWLGEAGFDVAFGPDLIEENTTPSAGAATPPLQEGRTATAERKSYADVILVERLKAAIERINPNISKEARQDALDIMLGVPWLKPSLIDVNRIFHKYLTEGVDVTVKDQHGLVRGDKVYLVDEKNLANNDWLAVNQSP